MKTDVQDVLQQAKQQYQSMPVPTELPAAVETALREASLREAALRLPRRDPRYMRWAAIIAACLCAAFMIALNASPVFAKGLYDVPVIGNIARVFTFREYAQENEDSLIQVRLPAIQNTGNSELEKRINYEIALKMNRELESAKARAGEWYEAYCQTGGDKAEFVPLLVSLDYEIKCNDDQVLSFVITKSETSATCYTEKFFYNIDLETGKELTLANLLGSRYQEKATAVIRQQMEERKAAEGEGAFFAPEDGGFTSLKADAKFYVNAQRQVVIVFDKYEVSPGCMGQPEFIIPVS